VPFQIGDLIDGHYRVEQRFAGGMGYVYIVLDEIVRKRFAIKQLAELHTENEILLERFRREASTWLQLDHHPHIVQAHSYMPRPEAPMLILEYVDGPSLEMLLRGEKRLAPLQVLRYGRQFCQAMQHAHARVIPDRGVGVMHRDIKPANIMLTRGNQLKVTDFGLAKIQGDASLTSHGQFVGTVAYSSPEQLVAADSVTPASDVYSFGAVMYQSLCGQPPFKATNAAELYHAIQETNAKPVGDFIAELSAAFAEVVMRCLKKKPAERIASFDELDAALTGLTDVDLQADDGTCAQCGFISRRKTSKCGVCGRATVDPREQTLPPSTKKWKCECGSVVSESQDVCPKCGRERAPQPAADSDAARVFAGSESSKALMSLPLKPDSSPRVVGTVRATWDLEPEDEYLVELKTDGFLLPWKLDRSGYTVGRDANMKIRLEDPSVARYHLFMVRLPCGWLAMNPLPNQRVEVNGWEAKQHMLRPADLMRVGETWLAFAGPLPEQDALAPIPGRWSDRVGPKAATQRGGGSAPTVQSLASSSCVLEIAGGGKFVSRGKPLRIGTSPLCEVRLNDSGAAPVAALLTWQSDGPHLLNLTGGLVRLVGGEIFNDRLLQQGDLLQVGSTPLRARIDGDPQLPARMMSAATTAAPPRLAITVLTGDQKGQSAILPTGEPATLGRLPDCDLVIGTDSYVSRRHLEFDVAASEINVKDLARRSGFFVNQTHFADAAVARLGDVIVVGKTSLLVHYELDVE